MIWIERQRCFLDFTLSSLSRRKGKNGALLLAYALVVFLLGSVMFFAQALRGEAQALLADSPEMVLQRMVAGRHDLIDGDLRGKIRAIRGVTKVQPRLWGYYFHPAAGANYTVMAREDFPEGDGKVVIGAGVARTWPGSGEGKLYFITNDGRSLVLDVADVLSESHELLTSDAILVSEPTFRKLMGVPEGRYTDFAVGIRNLAESRKIAEKIVAEIPDARPILREEVGRTYASIFDWRGGYVIVLLSGAALAFFIFAWDKATGLSGEEKTEIGILKALGWDTADILAIKFWEGSAISMTAFLLGVLGAYVHVFFASGILFAFALKGWAVLYPDFRLHPAVDPYQLVSLFFLTVLPYTLVTIIPVWRVASTDPDAVMRQA